jgi:hypothetical protein
MRTAAPGLCFSGMMIGLMITAASPVRASVEYRIQADAADLFRTQALEPPPLTSLSRGEVLNLIQRGAAASLMETAEGVQGWVSNKDLLAMQSARGGKFGLPEQTVTGARLNVSPDVWIPPAPTVDALPLDRSFSGEIIEAMDKEQVEMRHDDN